MFCVLFALLVLGVEGFHPITLTNAKQSSLFEDDAQWQANNAIDHNAGTFSKTASSDPAPWVSVDFVRYSRVHRVIIVVVEDTHAEGTVSRLTGAEVLLYNAEELSGSCGVIDSSPRPTSVGQIYEFDCGTPLGTHSGINSTSLKLQHVAGAVTLRVGEIIIKGDEHCNPGSYQTSKGCVLCAPGTKSGKGASVCDLCTVEEMRELGGAVNCRYGRIPVAGSDESSVFDNDLQYSSGRVLDSDINTVYKSSAREVISETLPWIELFLATQAEVYSVTIVAGEDSAGSEVLLYKDGVMAGACANVAEGSQVVCDGAAATSVRIQQSNIRHLVLAEVVVKGRVVAVEAEVEVCNVVEEAEVDEVIEDAVDAFMDLLEEE